MLVMGGDRRERRPGQGAALNTKSNLSGKENSSAPVGDQGPSIEPALIAKNQREVLRLSVDEYKGHILLSARLWFEPREGGELRPGKDGWAISVEKLLNIIAGLQRLEAEARAAWLLQ